MFSSYALSVMVLYIFKLDQSRGKEFRNPFHVFRYFLKFFSSFQWSRCSIAKFVVLYLSINLPLHRYVLTLNGPIVISIGSQKSDGQNEKMNSKDPFTAIITKIRENSSSCGRSVPVSAPFPLRCCNIVDPMNEANNLGFNVTKDCLERIEVALKGGHHHLETLVGMINHAHKSMNVAPALFTSYDPSNSVRSAFGMPPPSSAGFTNFSPSYAGVTSGAAGSLPIVPNAARGRSRADSTGGAAVTRSAVADSGPHEGSAFRPSLIGCSEYLTVFFAQCRARYMLNGACRYDLLDHPKQKAIYFNQISISDSALCYPGSRPGSTSTEINGDTLNTNVTDPLSGNIAEMWSIYLKAIENTHKSSEVDRKIINGQDNVFSVLQPSSDLLDLNNSETGRTTNSSSAGSKVDKKMTEEPFQIENIKHNESILHLSTPPLVEVAQLNTVEDEFGGASMASDTQEFDNDDACISLLPNNPPDLVEQQKTPKILKNSITNKLSTKPKKNSKVRSANATIAQDAVPKYPSAIEEPLLMPLASLDRFDDGARCAQELSDSCHQCKSESLSPRNEWDVCAHKEADGKSVKVLGISASKRLWILITALVAGGFLLFLHEETSVLVAGFGMPGIIYYGLSATPDSNSSTRTDPLVSLSRESNALLKCKDLHYIILLAIVIMSILYYRHRK